MPASNENAMILTTPILQMACGKWVPVDVGSVVHIIGCCPWSATSEERFLSVIAHAQTASGRRWDAILVTPACGIRF